VAKLNGRRKVKIGLSFSIQVTTRITKTNDIGPFVAVNLTGILCYKFMVVSRLFTTWSSSLAILSIIFRTNQIGPKMTSFIGGFEAQNSCQIQRKNAIPIQYELNHKRSVHHIIRPRLLQLLNFFFQFTLLL